MAFLARARARRGPKGEKIFDGTVVRNMEKYGKVWKSEKWWKRDWFDMMEAGHISEIYSISGMKRHVHAPWK